MTESYLQKMVKIFFLDIWLLCIDLICLIYEYQSSISIGKYLARSQLSGQHSILGLVNKALTLWSQHWDIEITFRTIMIWAEFCVPISGLVADDKGARRRIKILAAITD